MSRQNRPPAYSPPKDESTAWATGDWRAALRTEQDGAGGEAGQKRQTPFAHDTASPCDPEHSSRSLKRHPAAQAPPDIAEVIRHRRARIDQKRTLIAFLFKLIVIAGIGYALFTYVFGFAAMKGEQMYPRIRDGDLMLYYRLEDSFSIGDVVTFVRDNTRYTGRVVAKGGDTVSMDEVGQLSVNGNIQTEEIFYPTTVSEGSAVSFPLVVDESCLFLLCDMRTNAIDSRIYGAVGLDELDGKVITILRRRGI